MLKANLCSLKALYISIMSLKKYFKCIFIEFQLEIKRSSLYNLLIPLLRSYLQHTLDLDSASFMQNKQINKSEGGIDFHNLIWLEVDFCVDLLILVPWPLDLLKEQIIEESGIIYKRKCFFSLKFASGAEWEQEMTANERYF